MKTTLFSLLAISAAQSAVAHPELSSRQTPFDANAQRIDVHGLHEWQAPGLLDTRGPCPGLNALANHGYLPRTGIISLLDAIDATTRVFGMDKDLSTVLSTYGGAIDGLVAAWSIGGGPHIGIGGSHGNYESDSSPIMGDLNQYGRSDSVIMSQFQTLYDLQPDAATANYNMDVMTKFRKIRFDESIAKNPNFFYGPFAGTIVTQAAFAFIYRFMSNKTAEEPDGILNKEVLKSFFSVQGPEDNLQWVPGHERIPENWYTRNAASPYGLTGSIGADINILKTTDERIGQPGCNTHGKTNSYEVIKVSELSNGAYPDGDIGNPLCFGIAFANSQISKLPIADTVIQTVLLPAQNLLGCNTIPSINETAFEACNGYSFYGGPTGPIAPGSIQN